MWLVAMTLSMVNSGLLFTGGSSDQSLHNMGRNSVDNVLAILRGESVDAKVLLNLTACPSVRITASRHDQTN